MKIALSIATLRDIEDRHSAAIKAHGGAGDAIEYTGIVENEVPKLINEIYRLRQCLAQIGRSAKSAINL